MVKGTRTNRHRFQWGKIEEILRGNKSVGIRAELKEKRGADTLLYASATKGAAIDPLIAIRKSGIRSQNIEREVAESRERGREGE